jgi:hypothetical protein
MALPAAPSSPPRAPAGLRHIGLEPANSLRDDVTLLAEASGSVNNSEALRKGGRSMAGNIDRAKVLGFFTWTKREFIPLVGAAACMAMASWITYFGVGIALQDAEKARILIFVVIAAAALLASAAFLAVKALRSDRVLPQLYEELRKAQRFDYANILIRSFEKAGTALFHLENLDQAAQVAHAPEAQSPENRLLLEALGRKAVFLCGQQGGAEFMRFFFDGNSVVFAHSPVSVAVLYLSQMELIAYIARADIVRGAVDAEHIRRIPLQKVLGVTAETIRRRTARQENERLFREFERVIKNNPSREMIAVERVMRIVEAGGEDLVIPADTPDYWRYRRGSGDTGEADCLSQIAASISSWIEAAKAKAGQDLRPEP